MTTLAQVGGPVACAGLALLLVLRAPRARLAALGLAALGTVLLGLAVVPREPLLIAGGVCAALGLAVGLAGVFRAWPWLFPLLALACVPIRIGVHVGGSSTKLLVPLYVAVLGAALLLAWELYAGDLRAHELQLATWPLAAYIAWTGCSIAWTNDIGEGATELLAFYVPFTILALVVARLPWSRLGARLLYVEVTLMALAFAIVGVYQYRTREIFQNPKVIYSNAYAPFFRVNSVFWDPSVYGRFLVLALAPSIVLLALGRSLRLSLLALPAIAFIWIGLLISYSQSSFAALLVVVVGVCFLAWRWRALLAVVLAVAVLAGIAVAQPQVRRSLQNHTTKGLDNATSGRYNLVAQGVRIAIDRPVEGVGVGGFKRAYADRTGRRGKDPKKSASHNTPVTVAAETGFVGLGLFAALLAALAAIAYRRRGRPLPLIAGLGLAAVLCHSLFYNAFFEDPMTWGLIGLVVAAIPEYVVRAGVPVRSERREAVPA